MASLGTPAASSSVAMFPWSVMVVSPVSDPDPGRLAALGVERHDGERRPGVLLLVLGEPDDRGTDGGGLQEGAAAAFLPRALPFPPRQVHGGDPHPLAAQPRHVAIQLLAGVVP